MKALIISFFLLWGILVFPSYGQENSSNYLFEEFQEATVMQKNGSGSLVKVNYDLSGSKFIFIDERDQDAVKEFAHPENIAGIKVNERTFLPYKNYFVEVIQKNPSLEVNYRGRFRPQAKTGAYGVSTLTSSTKSLTHFQSGGITYNLKTDAAILADINKSFLIEVNGKKKVFTTKKQFLKIYPAKKEMLEKYIEENQVDFNSITDVAALYNYTVSL